MTMNYEAHPLLTYENNDEITQYRTVPTGRAGGLHLHMEIIDDIEASHCSIVNMHAESLNLFIVLIPALIIPILASTTLQLHSSIKIPLVFALWHG
jgi:hypothetical protein